MFVTIVAMSSISAVELANSDTPLALVLGKTAIGGAGVLIVQIGIMISVEYIIIQK